MGAVVDRLVGAVEPHGGGCATQAARNAGVMGDLDSAVGDVSPFGLVVPEEALFG